MNIKELIKARDEYIHLVEEELLGPGSEISIPDKEHELITDPPDVRYSIGILFPKNNKLNADNDDSLRIEESVSDSDDEIIVDVNDISEEDKSTEVLTPSEEDNLDEEIGLAAQNMPSSLGLTFLVSKDVERILCDISFATYRHALVDDCKIPFFVDNPSSYTVPDQLQGVVFFDNSDTCLKLRSSLQKKKVSELKERDFLDSDEYGIFPAMYKLCKQLKSGFVREPHSTQEEIVFCNNSYSDSNTKIDGTNAKLTALKRKISDNLYSITIMLVNECEEKSNATRCIFQPQIKINTEYNDFDFCQYSSLVDFNRLDDEEKSLELQYRNKHVYGTGLGTSVNWDIDSSGKGVIYNDFFPRVEVPSMDFGIPESSGIERKSLSMRYLSDLDSTSREEKIAGLSTVVSAYEEWIKSLEKKLGSLDKRYESIASDNIKGCKVALHRMKSGLNTLGENDLAWDAFQLANRAMFMQRVHLDIQSNTSNKVRYAYDEQLTSILTNLDYVKNENYTQDKHQWRLFQIAFMLMSVNSIVKEECPERNEVDLIWFPTGGGKTEAYLGLTAFTIFFRRLAYQNDADGTTVIMRYTLRLLAAQQFTRAATLICACEYIRNDATSRRPSIKRYPLGNKEINIGLWIGREHIPNKNDDAKSHIDKLNKATPQSLKYIKETHNKFQVLKCPWCGTSMVVNTDGKTKQGIFGYRMRNNSHFELFCPQPECHFNKHGRLPIQIIDEELYANPPTLLFGTVDKFAMIPWKKEIGAFFAANSNNRTPELIIQDELHLISGPLGTMVGLYETVIDALCKSKGYGPKIVSSTATIRRAKEQCSALYNRSVNQFPHPGLDAEDSFFAREKNIDYDNNSFGRMYVGLMPSGKTKAMMEVRSIAALLQKINTMQLPDDVKDKFWTLTVYFNSLRDLGKCSTLVDDDIKDFIKRTAYRLGNAHEARIITRADELTSRVTTTQLNETLDKLEKVSYSAERMENKVYPFPSNVLLATNMISVGIDVARLNVMLLVGQPKLTSEYIQASSRVGRNFPGVAFTMYDGSKSRDRSHYEQFKPYHESFYKFVEPTGATPFSKPARDRALHAIAFAILRLLEPDLSSDNEAGNFRCEKYIDTINKIKTFIVERSKEITARINPNMIDYSSEISEEIDYYFDQWQKMVETHGEDSFFYGEKFMMSRPEENEGRLLKPYNTSIKDAAFDTMTSMRNVDSTVIGNILIWED